MTRDLVILGCGGFGREVADVVAAINGASPEADQWNLIGYLDDSPSEIDSERLRRLGHRQLGTVDATVDALDGTYYVVAVGDPRARKKLVERCDDAGLSPASLIHPTARIGSDVSIGVGAIVCGGVSITTDIRIGRHVQVHPNSTIGHDSTIGDFVTVSPLVAVSGSCTIEDLAMLGTHSTVLPGISVCSGATIGASACVTRDVPPATTVKGVPAR